MNNVVTSIIRTVMSAILGYVFAWLLAKGIDIGETNRGVIEAWFIVTSQGVVYAAIRYAESRWPAVGWLLGIAKTPGYAVEDAPPAQPSPGPNTDTGAADLTGVLLIVQIVFFVLGSIWFADSLGWFN